MACGAVGFLLLGWFASRPNPPVETVLRTHIPNGNERVVNFLDMVQQNLKRPYQTEVIPNGDATIVRFVYKNILGNHILDVDFTVQHGKVSYNNIVSYDLLHGHTKEAFQQCVSIYQTEIL